MNQPESLEINGLIQISELIDKNIQQAFFIYAKLFGKLTPIKSQNKMMALNMFTEKLKQYMDSNNTPVLSDYAAIYALETGFEDEHKKVAKHIEDCIKRQNA